MGNFVCYGVEDEGYFPSRQPLSEVGVFAGLRAQTPSLEPGGQPHSNGQLWGTNQRSGSSSVVATVETGWIVDPGVFGDSQTHLFEYHTGDNYARDGSGSTIDCYDACGFQGIPGTPVMVGQTLAPGSSNTYGVILDLGFWWFYYGGYYYGYLAQSDASWQGNPLTRIIDAKAGGEVLSTVGNCPVTQMGNGLLGSSPTAAIVNSAELIRPNGVFFPPLSLVPNLYHALGNGYQLGGFGPSTGQVRYGGPRAC